MNNKMRDLTGLILTSESGKQYKLTKKAGNGAQGVVYEESENKYMIKLYYPSGSKLVDNDVLERLRFIKDVAMPKNFVSVKDLITHPYVGYVMDKVVEHKPLNSYLIPNGNVQFREWYNQGLGLYERMVVGYIIAKAFGELEKNNLSYCDISGNNILIKTGQSASVKMIDIDNIYIAGRGKSSVLGTPRYIAPEVINRQKNPDVLSDNYSLAVILFELLRVGHPYLNDDIIDGSPEEEENALLGNAEYVTDENSTNMLPADVVFTDKLKELFRRCFVDGKKNRLSRPSATEFGQALLEASNKLIKCPSCGAWHYPRKNGKIYDDCPWCDAPSRPSAMINFYDILYEGDNYQASANTDNAKLRSKLVNTYIIKQHRNNIVKSLYVLRFDDPDDGGRINDNYFIIASKNNDYYIYNKFGKDGIVVRQFATKKFTKIEKYSELKLHSGDEIYFEIELKPGICIECGNNKYSFIRMARFSEVKA